MQDSLHRAPLPSFGRRQGRKLRENHSNLFKTLLPELLITLPEGPLNPATLFASPAPLWFEIGFGGGEHLVEQARQNPDINFIGCEPYVNGMAKLLSSIEKLQLKNIRLFSDDARALLEKLPDNSIERLFILFPDPWPKNRHHKRRIISHPSLELFYTKVMSRGLLRIATDHVDYCTWMLEQLISFGKFAWQAKRATDWSKPPTDWVVTRYQTKAAAEGRNAIFLDWTK